MNDWYTWVGAAMTVALIVAVVMQWKPVELWRALLGLIVIASLLRVAFAFGVWHTWLGFIGLIAGLWIAAWRRWPPGNAGLAGLAVGVALVSIINVLDRDPVPCLSSAKGLQILRAYSLTCVSELTPNQPVRR